MSNGNDWKNTFENQIIQLLTTKGQASAKEIAEILQVDEAKTKYHLGTFVKNKASPIKAKGKTNNRVFFLAKREGVPPKARPMRVAKVHNLGAGESTANNRPIFNRVLTLLESIWESGQ